MKKNKTENGSVTIEATLCVTLFVLFMLFLVTLFFMVSVQNNVSHAIVQTADSLSLEAYSINKLRTDIDSGVKSIITDLSLKLFSSSGENQYFSTDQRWFDSNQLLEDYVTDANSSTYDPSIRKIDLSSVIKDRFVGFFANGDKEYADAYLTKMGVVDGLNGIDFSESIVEGDKLKIVANYQIKYFFNFGEISKVNISQSFYSKIWT